MAKISAKLVKELRDMTGAGMMDCKKALTATEGDLDKAVDVLREKGLGKAAKKSNRLASEGLVTVVVCNDFKSATILELNSETDFVAQNQDFIDMNKTIATHIQSSEVETVENLMTTTINGTVFEEYFKAQIARIGENLVTRKFITLSASETGIVNGYCHSNGRVGVIIGANCDSAETAKKASGFIKNLSMHAAAMKPPYLNSDNLDLDFVNKETVALIAEITKGNEELRRLKKPEKKIPLYGSKLQLTDEVMAKAEADIKAELKAQNKPEKIWNRIVPGQIERFIADNTQLDQQLTLVNQFYVMDDKKTIAQAVEAEAKKLGGTIELVEYIRFELGEGLEKKGCDFAAEVAEQLG